MANPGGEIFLLEKGDVLIHPSVGDNHYVWIVLDTSEGALVLCFSNCSVKSGGSSITNVEWERCGWTVVRT